MYQFLHRLLVANYPMHPNHLVVPHAQINDLYLRLVIKEACSEVVIDIH